MKHLYSLIFILILFSFFSCGKDDTPSIKEISLSEHSLIMKEGEEKTITVIHTPSELPSPSYIWRSSNSNVVEVINGHIKAIQEGNAIITCEVPDLNISTSCSVEVKEIVPESLSLSAENSYIYVGNTMSIFAVILPETAKDKSVKWITSNYKIATINQDGIVQGIAPGNVTITAITNKGNIRETFEIEILKISVESVLLNKTTLSLLQGQSETLEISINPANATFKNVKWSSENDDIAVVTQNGKVTGIKQGITTISATSEDGNISSTCEVSVTNNNNVNYNPYGEDKKW